MNNTIRAGVYGLVYFGEKVVSIKKNRGPYTGLLDLPGGKIEYFEEHKKALLRELEEEIGVCENDIEIQGLLSVEEDLVTAFWEGKNQTWHILATVYKVKIINPDFDLNYIEDSGDAGGIVLIDPNIDKELLTPIFTKVLQKRDRA